MNPLNAAVPGVLAFDLGGTRFKAGLVYGNAVTSLSVTELEKGNERERVIQYLCDTGEHLIASNSVQAIGIAVRGIVAASQGVILDANGPLSSLIGYPLADTLNKHFGVPVVIDNDARMYALGEWLHGAGQGCSNLVTLTLGTGIGSGVILDGHLLRGKRHVAGILGGHFTLQMDGPLCACGNRGCLEALIGTPALVQKATESITSARLSSLQQPLTPQRLFAAASGDPLASEIVTYFARTLGAGIVTMIHAYDPDKVVLGGGLTHRADLFLQEVQSYVDTHAWCIPRGRVNIVLTQLGDAAALVGIAVLASNEQAFV